MNQMKPSRNSYLAHYGVKGMKWGVRKDRKKSALHPDKNPNLKKLSSYNGPAYFISESEFHGKTLTPRIPKNFMTDNGYEDSQTPRVSFAPSVNQCLMGLSQNVSGKTYNVYAPADRHDFYKPNRKAVPDSDLTGELWVCEPIKVKKVGRITCTGDAGLPGKTYSYGSNKAELYDWKYNWTSRAIAHSESYLAHYGVKGMKWGVRRYRDKNGRLTEAGKKQAYLNRKARDAMKTTAAANSIVESLSSRDKALLGAEENEAWVPKERERETSRNIAKRIVETSPVMKEPAAFFEIWDNGGDVGEIAVASRTGEQYRGKGYAYSAAKKGKAWFDKYGYKRMKRLDWIVDETNASSIGLAKKLGFEEDKFETTHPEWNAKQTKGYKIYTYKKN